MFIGLNAHHLDLMDGKAGREFQCMLHIFMVAHSEFANIVLAV